VNEPQNGVKFLCFELFASSSASAAAHEILGDSVASSSLGLFVVELDDLAASLTRVDVLVLVQIGRASCRERV
jgi:hypothetical protein